MVEKTMEHPELENDKADFMVYVADLSAYNAGVLRGIWIDATQGEDYIYQRVQAMLATSKFQPHEEWAIHDTTGFSGLSLGEYISFEKVARIAEFLNQCEEEYPGYNLGVKLIQYHGIDYLDAAIQSLEDMIGHYDNLAEYAEEANEGRDIPAFLENYINWQAMGEDDDMNGIIFTIEDDQGGVFVFNNC